MGDFGEIGWYLKLEPIGEKTKTNNHLARKKKRKKRSSNHCFNSDMIQTKVDSSEKSKKMSSLIMLQKIPITTRMELGACKAFQEWVVNLIAFNHHLAGDDMSSEEAKS